MKKYNSYQKFCLGVIIMSLISMSLFGGFTKGSVFIAIAFTAAIIAIVVMIFHKNIYHEGTGQPREIREMVADIPYRLEAVCNICQKKFVWLRRIHVSHDHKKLIPDPELIVCEYDYNLISPNPGEQPRFVALTYEYDAPEPVFEAWRPHPGYTEHV